MLTPAQLALAEAVDAMRANEATIVVLTRDLESTRAERDAYYQHLCASQTEVQRLQNEVTALRLRVFELGDAAHLSRPAAEPAHEAESASTQSQPSEAPSPAAAGSFFS
jgi:hypothetical protein